jgi:hypothetical protein
MDAVYEIINWITHGNLYTHELPGASDKCKPQLLRWFPELQPTIASGKSLDECMEKAQTCPDAAIKMWLTELKMMFPDIRDTYDVPRILED